MKLVDRFTRVVAMVLATVLVVSGLWVPGASLDAWADGGSTGTVMLDVEEVYSEASVMLDLINEERAANGVAPLVWDSELAETAMLRGAECAVYFGHTRPNGQDCFSANSRMNGENIAASTGELTAENAMSMLMNSEGHRNNILSSAFKSVGLAIVYADSTTGTNGYAVQVFSTTDSTDSTQITTDINSTYEIEFSSSLIGFASGVDETVLFDGATGVTQNICVPIQIGWLAENGWTSYISVYGGSLEYSASSAQVSINDGVAEAMD